MTAKSRPTITPMSNGLVASICQFRRKRSFEKISGNEQQAPFVARYEGKIIAGVVIRFCPSAILEYAANSSLESALRLRPNDLLHWRAIEWACREGLSHYSLGGAHLFLRKFGSEIVSTTRCRLDLSTLRGYTLRDWLAEKVDQGRMQLPPGLLAKGRSWRYQVAAKVSTYATRFRPTC